MSFYLGICLLLNEPHEYSWTDQGFSAGLLESASQLEVQAAAGHRAAREPRGFYLSSCVDQSQLLVSSSWLDFLLDVENGISHEKKNLLQKEWPTCFRVWGYIMLLHSFVLFVGNILPDVVIIRYYL